MVFRVEDVMGRIPDGDVHGRHIFEAVREGLWPFRPWQIQVYLEFDIDFNRYWIMVDVIFKDGYRLSHKEPIDAWDLAADPFKETFRVSQLMRSAFRNREDYSLAPLIHLGNN